MNFTEYSHHALEKFLSDSLILSAKDDAAMPTEAFVPLDCFIAADFFFSRESQPFGVRIISHKDNQGGNRTSSVMRVVSIGDVWIINWGPWIQLVG